MKSNRFFTIAFDARNSSKMRYVERKVGDGLLTFGRWIALLGMLHEQDGAIDLSAPVMREVVRDELEFANDEELDAFVEAIADVRWVDPGMWHDKRHLISENVIGQIEYRKKRAEAGRKGGEAQGGNRKKKGA